MTLIALSIFISAVVHAYILSQSVDRYLNFRQSARRNNSESEG